MRILFLLLFTLTASTCFAQCVAEIKDVRTDPVYGGIIVETEYSLNGVVVQPEGRVRFVNTSGSDNEIKKLAKMAIDVHCANLIKRIPNNERFIETEKEKRRNELKVGRDSDGIVTSIKTDLVGYSKSITRATKKYREKNINVTHDENNTITSAP